MLAEFSIVPIGVGEGVSAYVARVIELVESRGLPYKLTPMGTVVEGEWDEVMALIKDCHALTMGQCNRVLTTIRVDDRRGRTGAIEGKIKSVESKLGKS